jgi:hypothetical protein
MPPVSVREVQSKEDEDYYIAVFVGESIDRAALQENLYDLSFRYDGTHGTSSLCYV